MKIIYRTHLDSLTYKHIKVFTKFNVYTKDKSFSGHVNVDIENELKLLK